MPLCFGASGSVRASSMPRSAVWPPDVHTFWPVITHSSPSRSAFARPPARPAPAPAPAPGDDREQVALLRLVGAVRVDRGPGEQRAETGGRADGTASTQAL